MASRLDKPPTGKWGAMAITGEKIKSKFLALEREAQKILRDCGWDGKKYRAKYPSDIDYQRWRTEATNLIERVCGRNSAHYEMIRRIAEDKGTRFNSYYLKDYVGILEAALHDYEGGLLIEIRHLIRAEILDDFLSQAESLAQYGYHVAAASLSGAVLEDTLRKLCDKHSVGYPDKTNINILNVELARAEIYDRLIQKQVTAWADLRNSADHGHFDKVRPRDVADMLTWIRRFVSEWLR